MCIWVSTNKYLVYALLSGTTSPPGLFFLLKKKKKTCLLQDKTLDILKGNPAACCLTLTSGVLCEGLASDASGWLLEGVSGGGGGRAGAGVVTCHVG